MLAVIVTAFYVIVATGIFNVDYPRENPENQDRPNAQVSTNFPTNVCGTGFTFVNKKNHFDIKWPSAKRMSEKGDSPEPKLSLSYRPTSSRWRFITRYCARIAVTSFYTS